MEKMIQSVMANSQKVRDGRQDNPFPRTKAYGTTASKYVGALALGTLALIMAINYTGQLFCSPLPKVNGREDRRKPKR